MALVFLINFVPLFQLRLQTALTMGKNINRIKVVLADKNKTNKWLAEQLQKDPGTVSKWCTNTMQPNVETLVEIARCLDVDIKDLLRSIDEISEA